MLLRNSAWDAFDIERFTALQPDLVITSLTPELDLTGAAEDTIAQIAPIAGLALRRIPVNAGIARLEAVAGAVGADIQSAQMDIARDDFARASEVLRAAIAEKPGLTTLFMASLPEDQIYIANPAWFTDLLYFQELGLDIVMPDSPDGDGPTWETLSWEQATKYPVDLVFQRADLPFDDLNNVPTWALHPAAQAGQIGAWMQHLAPSYQGFTPALEALTETIRNSRDDVV